MVPLRWVPCKTYVHAPRKGPQFLTITKKLTTKWFSGEVIKVKREEVSIGSETATGKPAKCESTTKLSLSEHVNLALDEDPGLTEKVRKV